MVGSNGAAKARVAVVTGGAEGIGRAVVRRLAADGWAVCVADVNAESGEVLAKQLRTDGFPAMALVTDVSAEDDMIRLADAAESELGPIGAWVNNAGITRPAMVHKMEVAAFDAVLAVHARGTFLGIREAARRMIASGTPGTILNVTSSAGLGGTLGQINYAGAKGAIIAMTKSAAKELGRYGIRVNTVAPSAETSMTQKVIHDPKFSSTYLSRIPLGRFAQAEEMAGTFSFLLSDDAGYMTGQVLSVDGGTYMVS